MSLAIGLLVGAIYAVLRVPSPAPPLVALVGLLGIVIGERSLSYLVRHRSPASAGMPVKGTHLA